MLILPPETGGYNGCWQDKTESLAQRPSAYVPDNQVSFNECIKPCENSREKFRYTVQNSGFKVIHDAIMTPEVDVNLDIML
jgi:hypothetical protein